MPFSVMTILGTRPEVNKLAPVIEALNADPDLRSRVVVTAQHRDLLDQMLDVFGIEPDVDLDLMRPGHTLAEVTNRVLGSVDGVLAEDPPDLVLVQGDTTTVFAAALAAFYRGIPVGHVEAGLRSFDLQNPFPEEANRKLATQIASLHFVPTRRARENLLREQVSESKVFLTGNTAVDAILRVSQRADLPAPPEPWRDGAGQAVYVTLHRRENWGAPLEGFCRSILRAADEFPQLSFVYPVHPQPRVRDTVQALLGSHPRVHLLGPLDFLSAVAAMKACSFIVTDSGGIQEEAPVLGKPVLVLRKVTERPEAVEAGTSWLVGTDEQDVYDAIATMVTDTVRRESMAHAASPFGDGRAAERIVVAIRRYFGLPVATEPPALA